MVDADLQQVVQLFSQSSDKLVVVGYAKGLGERLIYVFNTIKQVSGAWRDLPEDEQKAAVACSKLFAKAAWPCMEVVGKRISLSWSWPFLRLTPLYVNHPLNYYGFCRAVLEDLR